VIKEIEVKVYGIDEKATLGIFSPSEPITNDRKDRFEKGLSCLLDQGFDLRIAKNAMNNDYYSAGTIEERVSDISELLRDQDVNALIASWGGKSCNQLLEDINFEEIVQYRKPILAFSDGCVLLNTITAKTGVFTFHGPNVAGKMYETKHANLDLIRKDIDSSGINILGNTSIVNPVVLRHGTASGRLFGGNLSTFTLGAVSPSLINEFKGGIFFWESLGEPTQIVHQYLQCLRNAGLFENISAMVIGDYFTQDDLEYKRRPSQDMLMDVCRGFNFPIYCARTFGHPGDLENPIIPIGPVASLDTKIGSLVLEEEVCI
jgi:muramoyltetrapeptide carboxypeptidase